MSAPTSNEKLYAYFTAEAFSPIAVNYSGGGRSTTVDGDRRLVMSGTVDFAFSKVSKFERIHEAMQKLSPDDRRVLRLQLGPKDGKPELKLVEDPQRRAWLGAFRMLLDETPSARAAYRDYVERTLSAGAETAAERRMLRRAEATGIEEAGLLRAGGTEADPARGPEARASRARRAHKRWSALLSVDVVRVRPTVLGIGAWLLTLDQRVKSEKAILTAARTEAEQLYEGAWRAWLEVCPPELLPVQRRKWTAVHYEREERRVWDE